MTHVTHLKTDHLAHWPLTNCLLRSQSEKRLSLSISSRDTTFCCLFCVMTRE